LLISSNLDDINEIMINYFIKREIDGFSELHLSLPKYKFIYVVQTSNLTKEITYLHNIKLDYLYDDNLIYELKN
jgi:ABC-type lipoprotein export system ATPase subunit